jgi:hypothetical protein
MIALMGEARRRVEHRRLITGRVGAVPQPEA